MEKNTRIAIISCSAIAILAVIAAIVIGLLLWKGLQQAIPSITISERREIGLLPTQIQSIRDIGQWEFLSIDDEELVDTMRSGFLFDDHLVCIYRGTLRLGIDMQEIREENISVSDDSLSISLPQVGLLDESFIDEARTEIFFENGQWSAYTHDRLRHRAEEQMKARALTTENRNRAQQLAEQQIRQLFQAMGYNHVAVTFEEQIRGEQP